MNAFESVGRLLIIAGLLILLMGGIMLLLSKFSLPGFHLPGDIYIKKENYSFYFPITTCILLSVVLSVLLNLFVRR